MTIDVSPYRYTLHEHIIPAALAQLPSKMDTPEARAMLLAIAMQESRCRHRVQLPNGPAHGFWQFERGGGVHAVLTHKVSGPILLPILDLFGYGQSPRTAACYAAIVHNDVLACIFARLLLWTVPGRLAGRNEELRGWTQYIEGWRPGKPHHDSWGECFAEGWRIVLTE